MQVEPEEGVMGDRPEGRVCWGSRVTPEESMPMHAGTGKQSVFQHVDRRTELLPQSGAQRCLHQLFSHNVCSFLLFSHNVAQKAVKKCPHIEGSALGRVVRQFAQKKCTPSNRR